MAAVLALAWTPVALGSGGFRVGFSYHGGYGHYHRPYYGHYYHRRGYYSYGYWPYCRSYSPPSYYRRVHVSRPTVYVVTRPAATPEATPTRRTTRSMPSTTTPAQPPRTPVRAADPWELLERGDIAAARTRFSEQAVADPRSGGPKVGFAVATAIEQKDDMAVWAMRRALLMEPTALDATLAGEKLRERIDFAVERYRRRAADGGIGTRVHEMQMMVASLRYLLGDYDAAAEAIDEAVKAGAEADEAIVALHDLLAARPEPPMPYDYEPRPGRPGSSRPR